MIPIRPYLAVLCTTALTTPALAAEPPLQRTEPVIVTATRFEQSPEDFPIGVTVIGRDAIEKSTATSVIELLSHQAGIQVRDSTGSPDLQIDLRGFGQTGDLNTTVLVDGQRFNEIDTAPVKWSSIPLGAVERVEVLRGSGAVLYGSGATGGVINIITRRPEPGESSAVVQASAGSYGTSGFEGAFAVASETLGIRLNAADLRSDNYRENNRLAQQNLIMDARTLGPGGGLYAKMAIDRQDLRNPGQRTLAQLETDRRGTSTPNDFSSRDGVRLDFGGETTFDAGEAAANFGYRRTQNQAFFAAFSSTVDNDIEGLSFSPRVKLAHKTGGLEQTLIGGIDLEAGRLDRNVSGVFFAGRTEGEQRRRGMYLQNNAALTPRLLLTLGARVQWARTTLDDPATAPAPLEKTHVVHASEAALRYQLATDYSIYGKVGRSFRLPSVEEINFTGPAILAPQTSRDVEFGGEYRVRGRSVRVSLYRYDLENEIAFNPFLFDNVNLAPTRREGIEIESTLRISTNLELFANFAYLNARFRSGVYAGVDVSGNRVPLVPRNTATLGATWRAAPKTRVSATLRSVGEQRLLNDEANTLAVGIPRYTTLDLKVAHATGDWEFEAGVRNLLNEKYYTQGGVNTLGVIAVFPAAERAGYVMARYSFR